MRRICLLTIMLVAGMVMMAQAETRNVKTKSVVVGELPVMTAGGGIAPSGIASTNVAAAIVKVNVLNTNAVKKATSKIVPTNNAAVTTFNARNTTTNEMADLIAILLNRTQ